MTEEQRNYIYHCEALFMLTSRPWDGHRVEWLDCIEYHLYRMRLPIEKARELREPSAMCV